MAWAFVGVSSPITVTATTLTLSEPAGCITGDLLVACIASRTTATTGVTLPTGWTLVDQQNNNNILSTTSAVASGTMAYIVRGASAPALGFTLPAGISVAMGQIVAYRSGGPPDVSTAVTTAIATTAVSVAGLTTTNANELIVAMAAGGQEAAWSSFNATTPSGASGATSSAAPTTAWLERADNVTTSGVDTSLGIFDAIKATAGATGNLTVTASLGGGNVIIAGAFTSLADAWSSADKSASITLSNVNKTATTTTSSGGVRSVQRQTNGTAGKWYAELKVDTLAGSGSGNCGIKTLTSSITSGALETIRVFLQTGEIYYETTLIGTLAAGLTTGDVLCVAWDAGAERVWFRKNSNLWNNDAAANPATGTNGIDVSLLPNVGVALWFQASAAGYVTTIRAKSADLTQTGPSGFLSWTGEALPTGPTDVTVTGAQTTLATTQSANAALLALYEYDLVTETPDYIVTEDSFNIGVTDAFTLVDLNVTGAQTTSATTQSVTVGVVDVVTGIQTTLASTQSATASSPATVTGAQATLAATSSATVGVGLKVTGGQTTSAAGHVATATVYPTVTATQAMSATTQTSDITLQTIRAVTGAQATSATTQVFSVSLGAPFLSVSGAQATEAAVTSVLVKAIVTANAAQTLLPTSKSMTGNVVVGVTGSQMLPAVGQSTAAALEVKVTGAQATAAAVSAAAVGVRVTLTGSQTTSTTTQASDITAPPALSVTGAQTTHAAAQTLSASLGDPFLSVSGDQVMQVVTGVATADVDIAVTGAQATLAATQGATATISQSVTGAQATLAATQAATAAVRIAVTGAQATEAVSQAATAGPRPTVTGAQVTLAAVTAGALTAPPALAVTATQNTLASTQTLSVSLGAPFLTVTGAQATRAAVNVVLDDLVTETPDYIVTVSGLRIGVRGMSASISVIVAVNGAQVTEAAFSAAGASSFRIVDGTQTTQAALSEATATVTPLPIIGYTWVKVGGVWRQVQTFVKVDGVWKAATPYVKTGDVWKKAA